MLDFASLPNPGAGTAEGRQRYLLEQSVRFAKTVRLCTRLCPNPQAAVLDVGRSNLSSRLLGYYAVVTTLGLPLEITQNYAHTSGWEPPPGKEYAGHIVCDLNKIPTQALSADQCRFDLIVFAEVIEHLFAAPYAALAWLRHLLKEGGMIICTTPNAASISKRFKLLCGKNPGEPLRYDLNNPGHVREYTKKELYEMGRLAELEVVMHRYVDYHELCHSGAKGVISQLVSCIIPSFGPDQMILYRKPSTGFQLGA